MSEYYENWVDKLIYTHQVRLDNLKTNRIQENYNIHKNNSYSNLEYLSKEDLAYNPISYRNNFKTQIQSENCNNNQTKKYDKIFDSVLEENSYLKMKLKNFEIDNDTMNNKQGLYLKKYNLNSELFFEREQDLFETLKLLEKNNKRLEEKVNELNNELYKKTRELDLALMSNEDVQIQKINNFLIKNKNSTKNCNNEDEVNLLCLKLDKIIEIFLNFFNKFESLKNVEYFVKIFDYENLKIKLNEFKGMIKKFDSPLDNKFEIVSENKDEILKTNFMNYNNFKMPEKSRNNHIQVEQQNVQNEESVKKESLKETEILLENNCLKNTFNSNISLNENSVDILSKLDQRLKDLENNVTTLMSSKNKKLSHTSLGNEKNTSSTGKFNKLNSSIGSTKNTNINTNKGNNRIPIANSPNKITQGRLNTQIKNTKIKSTK